MIPLQAQLALHERLARQMHHDDVVEMHDRLDPVARAPMAERRGDVEAERGDVDLARVRLGQRPVAGGRLGRPAVETTGVPFTVEGSRAGDSRSDRSCR